MPLRTRFHRLRRGMWRATIGTPSKVYESLPRATSPGTLTSPSIMFIQATCRLRYCVSERAGSR